MDNKQQEVVIVCGLCSRTKKQLDELKITIIQGGAKEDGSIPCVCGDCVTIERNKLIAEGVINDTGR